MIKTKVHTSACGFKKFNNSEVHVCDYVKVTYLFGVIIHSVTLKELTLDAAKKIFKNHLKSKR